MGYVSFPYGKEDEGDGHIFTVIGIFVYYPPLPLDYIKAFFSTLFTS